MFTCIFALMILTFYMLDVFLVCLQGTQLFASLGKDLKNPELRRLANKVPFRVVQAKAPSTVDRYSRAFNEFKRWASDFDELVCLPATSLSVSLYLEHLIESECSTAKLESAYYGIHWAHQIFGIASPCDCSLVKHLLEAGKRKVSKPIVKKEPVTLEMMTNICLKYAHPEVNLSDLRLAALCVTAFNGFLRFSELSSLRCCDVRFSNKDSVQFVQLYIQKSKTDIYRDGACVLLAKSDNLTCPFTILKRYVNKANIDVSSQELFFRRIQFVKSTNSYVLRSGGLSYTRMRELVLGAFESLGYRKEKFGLHSLRSGGATAAANAGVNDRLFKRHGRWKSETAKDGYVKDNLESLLLVSQSLNKKR